MYREAERREKAEKANDVSESAEEAVEQSDEVEAEQVTTNAIENAENASNKEFSLNLAEEAKDSDNVKCELCDSTFRNTRGLKVHKGRAHKTVPQSDGFEEEIDNEHEYTFESDYAEEDIKYTLEEILSDEIVCNLVSRVKIGSERSANHLCTVNMSIPRDGWQWPVLNTLQGEVIKNLKLSSSCC